MDNNELKKALLQAFAEEAPELLIKAESALLDLEASPAGVDQQSCADALKRTLHSLKGSASAIGRADIRHVCHVLEDLLINAGEHVTRTDILDKLHSGVRFLKEAILALDVELDVKTILDELSSVGVTRVALEPPPAAVILTEAPAELSPPTPVTASAVQPALSQDKGREKDGTLVSETIRVAVSKIAQIQGTVGELVAIRLQHEASLQKLTDLQKNIDAYSKLWLHIKSDINSYRHLLPKSEITKLDQKISAFGGQLKGSQRDIFHLSSQVRNQSGQLTLLSEEMDTGLRAIRMMPLGPFFESFRSVARDAARQADKTVQLECVDKHIEIDRLVMEKIKEPLLHLVRNAISHGLESTANRAAAGKSPSGNIKLSADLNGDYVYIQIIDDGAGFNHQKIYDKALSMGLIKPNEELTNDKILDIVSRSGFSTTTKTDMLSGRGIGMDVVSSMVSELGGKVDLETEEGMGTCITLQVPSSLATTQGLILKIGNQLYGVALDMVERIVRTRIDALSFIESKQVIYLDDDPISVTSLASVLQQSQLEPRHARTTYPLIILKSGNRRLALLVDDIPGEIPLIIKSMGPQFEHISIYSGGAIMSDGGVLPVLNVRTVIDKVSQQVPRTLQVLEDDNKEDIYHYEAMTNSRGAILVVDDSITTRTLERNILEAAGYTVSVATDGIEAMDQLMTEDDFALVVTDMEMPRMNGIELCRKIRASRFADLPIIMVTSVSNETEMKKGLEAGADAYVVKGDFQQEHFLDLVHRLGRF